jgi:copper(I)-binding protein
MFIDLKKSIMKGMPFKATLVFKVADESRLTSNLRRSELVPLLAIV